MNIVIHYIFSREITCFIHYIIVIFSQAYFHTVKISKVWNYQASVKLHILHALFKDLTDTCSIQIKENVIKSKFNAFDVEYEIYFTREMES